MFSLFPSFLLVDHGSEGRHDLILLLQPLLAVEVSKSSAVIGIVDLVLLPDTYSLHTTMSECTDSKYKYTHNVCMSLHNTYTYILCY